MRRLVRRGAEHLTAKNRARLEAALLAGDPNLEVTVAWHCAQQLRSVYRTSDLPAGRRKAEQLLDRLHTCPIPEIARLGRTLRSWRTEFLAYFDTDRVSDGPSEAMNLLVEKTRRMATATANFANYGCASYCTAASTGRLPTRHESAPAVHVWWRRALIRDHD